MIASDRNVYVGAHVTAEIKAILKTIAKSRKISVSKLLFQMLSNSPEVRAVLSQPEGKLRN